MFRPSRHLATNVTVGSEDVAIGSHQHGWRTSKCGGHVAVHGRDKYLNLLACGGVALGSQ
jgi:hypothetical protein